MANMFGVRVGCTDSDEEVEDHQFPGYRTLTRPAANKLTEQATGGKGSKLGHLRVRMVDKVQNENTQSRSVTVQAQRMSL